MSEFDMDDWRPPTEAEMKVIEARRERSDKISKLMGDYLLKGYRMLGICCQTCDTILLQDKHGCNYCVACQELDADNIKDDPALSDVAALRQAAEYSQRSAPPGQTANPSDSSSHDVGASSFEITHAQQESTQCSIARSPPNHVHDDDDDVDRCRLQRGIPGKETLSVRPKTTRSSRTTENMSAQMTASQHQTGHSALSALYDKLKWATVELTQTTDVSHSQQLCVLIRQCAEAVAAVQSLDGLQC